MGKKNIIVILFILSLIGNAFLVGNYFFMQGDFAKVREAIEQKQTNKKVADFSTLFIEKVLKAEKDVDFEERLMLETAVRDLNDPEILLQWRKFTESKVKEDAQREVKNLLELLLVKIAT
ncbi:MAG: hypothetical protein Q7K33_03910 [Candidatus Berkelbacteria bacterium]|nr:hypothetical protein [Candidatus Berkelbacteria bacterium]